MSALKHMQRAAHSILDSDRRKAPPLGGKLNQVVDVDVVETNDDWCEVVLTSKNGSTARAEVLRDRLNLPTDRTARPADVHDAVSAAMFVAAGALA